MFIIIINITMVLTFVCAVMMGIIEGIADYIKFERMI